MDDALKAILAADLRRRGFTGSLPHELPAKLFHAGEPQTIGRGRGQVEIDGNLSHGNDTQ